MFMGIESPPAFLQGDNYSYRRDIHWALLSAKKLGNDFTITDIVGEKRIEDLLQYGDISKISSLLDEFGYHRPVAGKKIADFAKRFAPARAVANYLLNPS
jgi:hypothetical protein